MCAGTCSWAAGRFTSATISVHGCSTCSRGFSSRKWKLPSSPYRYSTVPALTYPTIWAMRTAHCGRGKPLHHGIVGYPGLEGTRRIIIQLLVVQRTPQKPHHVPESPNAPWTLAGLGL